MKNSKEIPNYNIDIDIHNLKQLEYLILSLSTQIEDERVRLKRYLRTRKKLLKRISENNARREE